MLLRETKRRLDHVQFANEVQENLASGFTGFRTKPNVCSKSLEFGLDQAMKLRHPHQVIVSSCLTPERSGLFMIFLHEPVDPRLSDCSIKRGICVHKDVCFAVRT